MNVLCFASPLAMLYLRDGGLLTEELFAQRLAIHIESSADW